MDRKDFPKEMLLFGCGNMAGAMVEGWLAAGVPASAFHIVKPTSANIPDKARYFASASEISKKYKTLMIGIKPQKLQELADDIQSLIAPDALVISILGGVECESLKQLFPKARILRVMPNLAVALGQSPLGIYGDDVEEAEREGIDAMLAPLGQSEWLDSEEQMDAFTALAGSGPAFVYRFIDALAAAGVATGLDEKQAVRIAKQMVVGASQLATQSEHDPAELARRVASPGGMTAEGLDILDEDGALAALVKNTLRATRDRGAELAKMAKGEK